MIVNIPIMIPDWIEWVATDNDGFIHGYDTEPELDSAAPFWCCGSGVCKYKHIGTTETPQDWTQELYQIIDGELVKPNRGR